MRSRESSSERYILTCARAIHITCDSDDARADEIVSDACGAVAKCLGIIQRRHAAFAKLYAE